MIRMLMTVVSMALAVVPRAFGQETGALTIQVGGASSLSPRGDGVRPSLVGDLSFVTGAFSLGPEVGVYFTGSDSLSPNTRPESVVTLGGVTRYRFGGGGGGGGGGGNGHWRAYGVGGLGLYAWDSFHPMAPTGSYLSASLGLGVSRRVTRNGSAIQAELRLHQLLQRTGVAGTRRFVALTAGFSWGW